MSENFYVDYRSEGSKVDLEGAFELRQIRCLPQVLDVNFLSLEIVNVRILHLLHYTKSPFIRKGFCSI